MTGEKGLGAARWTEQGAADASESEGAGGVAIRGGAGQSALELGDALAQRVVGQVQQPPDFLPRMATEGEQGGDAQGWREMGEFGGCGIGMCGGRGQDFAPAGFAATPTSGGAGVEGCAIANDAGQPAAGLRCGKIGTASFEGSQQRRLHEIVSLFGPARGAAGEGVQVCKGARSGHSGRLARSGVLPKRLRDLNSEERAAQEVYLT